LGINLPAVPFPFRFCLFILLTGLCYFQGFNQACTLEGFLDKGVSNSPAIKDISNQILSNQYDSLIARAAYLPQVNFNGYLMYAPSVNGWGYSEVITNGQQLAGTLNVNHQIFNKKTREANYEKYGLESGSLANSRNISVNELKRAITAQYLAVFAAAEERNFQQDILVTMKHQLTVLKSWTEKGIYRQTDYLAFQVEIMTLERNIRDLDLQYRKEFWNLNLICGNNDTTSCNLQLPEFRDTTNKTAENSIYFRQFRIDSLLILNEKSLVDRRYAPAVSWFADGGLVNNEPRYLYQNFGISAGLNITLPVFDGNQRKINYDKFRIREETRKNYQENFRFRYQAQLNQLQAELERIRISMVENEKQVSLIRELVAADKVLLNIGSAPMITDYILVLKNLVEAQHAGLLYKIRTQYILNEINYWKQ
jgi:outer membrane protein TolC